MSLKLFSITILKSQLSIEKNLIRLDGHAYGIVTKNAYKTLPGSFYVCLTLKLSLVQLFPVRSLPNL